VTQPPGIAHAELAHSADLEMLEITVPAEFATESAVTGTTSERPAPAERSADAEGAPSRGRNGVVPLRMGG
jgi:hypothetical protein